MLFTAWVDWLVIRLRYSICARASHITLDTNDNTELKQQQQQSYKKKKTERYIHEHDR